MSLMLLTLALALSGLTIALLRTPLQSWFAATSQPELKQVARVITVSMVVFLAAMCFWGALTK